MLGANNVEINESLTISKLVTRVDMLPKVPFTFVNVPVPDEMFDIFPFSAFRVENEPIPDTIVPDEIVEMVAFETIALMAVSVDTPIVLNTVPLITRLETAKVEASRFDTDRVLNLPVLAFIVLAISVLITRGLGITTVPVDILTVEKLPILALNISVENPPVYRRVVKGKGPCVRYPAHPWLAKGNVATFP